MSKGKVYIDIKPTIYCKLKMRLIVFFRSEQWSANFLNDVKAHPHRYFRTKQVKPPDEEAG